jgi:hypothetical protein
VPAEVSINRAPILTLGAVPTVWVFGQSPAQRAMPSKVTVGFDTSMPLCQGRRKKKLDGTIRSNVPAPPIESTSTGT